MADLEEAVRAALLTLGRSREARAVQQHAFDHLQQTCEKIGVSQAKSNWSRIMRQSKEGAAFLIAPHGKEEQATLVISVARLAEILGDVSMRLDEKTAAAPKAAALLAPLAHLPPALEPLRVLGGEEDPLDLQARNSPEAAA